MSNWTTYNQLLRYQDLRFSLDTSRMDIPTSYTDALKPKVEKAYADLTKLEAGEIANPDENRMVGHYWLRNADLAPNDEIRAQITEPIEQLKQSPLTTYFFDNTDPAGCDITLTKIGKGLNKTLSLVVSKSGGTAETRNAMLEAQHAFEEAGLKFGEHAGRCSVMSTVGLVPAALQGIDIDSFLKGAKDMDEKTRVPDTTKNAAMQLALAWHHAGNGKGEKDMVILPYKDSLVLFSKYLQQLVMESLGKEHDLDGNVVNQGIAVYGNKGSTDQHAYVQQLRDGVHNFFATFIEVKQGRKGESIEVDPGNTSADYLQGFLRGTRKALYESGRKSITISINEVTPYSLGMLIALFERAVTF